jgi:tetratricopeptide (TPR) repeat protein|tara:strand:- start:771 stop:2057 length:1287 start_codon:yes stop_codon:yes gene_type:complete
MAAAAVRAIGDRGGEDAPSNRAKHGGSEHAQLFDGGSFNGASFNGASFDGGRKAPLFDDGGLFDDRREALLADVNEEAAALASALEAARRALAEAEAMRERVDEVARMARGGSWEEALTHSHWLAHEYPHHRTLVLIRIESQLALGRVAEAAALCEGQLEVNPDDPMLLSLEARSRWLLEGTEAALALMQSLPEIALTTPCCEEMVAFLTVMRESELRASHMLHSGELTDATVAACEALALSSECARSSLPIFVVLAAALARRDGHAEAIQICDRALRLELPSIDPPSIDPPTPTPEHEKLYLRRGGCFLALGMPSKAIADYRSAAAIRPTSAQAAAGMRRAAALIHAEREASSISLYEMLGVGPQASERELKKAFHERARRCHPDKLGTLDSLEQNGAAARFAELHAAYMTLTNDEERAAYDRHLEL